jgi:ParB family chromosome partitioning protein
LITLGFCYDARSRFSGGAYRQGPWPLMTRRAPGSLLDVLLRQLRSADNHFRALSGIHFDTRCIDSDDLSRRAVGLRSLSESAFTFCINDLHPTIIWIGQACVRHLQCISSGNTGAEKFAPNKIKLNDLAKSGGVPDEME